MSIKSGQTVGLMAVGTADTVIDTSLAGQSHEYYAAMIHNSAVGVVTVEVFVSADGVSAIGERVQREAIDSGATIRLQPILIPATYSLIAKADTTGATFSGIYTIRTGTDV